LPGQIAVVIPDTAWRRTQSRNHRQSDDACLRRGRVIGGAVGKPTSLRETSNSRWPPIPCVQNYACNSGFMQAQKPRDLTPFTRFEVLGGSGPRAFARRHWMPALYEGLEPGRNAHRPARSCLRPALVRDIEDTDRTLRPADLVFGGRLQRPSRYIGETTAAPEAEKASAVASHMSELAR